MAGQLPLNTNKKAPKPSGDVPGWLKAVGNFLEAHNPLGGYDRTLENLGGGGGQSDPFVAAVSANVFKQPDPHQVTKDVQVPFDLSKAVQQAASPYELQMLQALGINHAGQGAPTAGSAIPGLAEYLKYVNPQTAQTIQSGLNNVVSAEGQMPGAINAALSNEGNAGMLTDLLNAARYQAIYKQNLYGSPGGTKDAAGQPNPLAQLFNDVTQAGLSVFGSGGNQTVPGGTKSPTNPQGVKPPTF